MLWTGAKTKSMLQSTSILLELSLIADKEQTHIESVTTSQKLLISYMFVFSLIHLILLLDFFISSKCSINSLVDKVCVISSSFFFRAFSVL